MPQVLRSGLCSVTFRGRAPEEIIALAAEAGIEAVEWGGDVHVPPADRRRAAEVGEATRAAGLAVSSYGSYIRPPTDGPATFDAAAETALALGAPMIRVWPGAHNKPSSDYSEEERAEATRAIAEMGARAGDQGLAIGLEYHPNTLTDDLASASRLIGEIDCAAVHLYWQPRPGLARDEGRQEIETLATDVAHLHVFQWNAAKDRFSLADGADTWRAFLAALQPSRWQGTRYAMLEFVRDDDPEQFRADAACLTRLLASAA